MKGHLIDISIKIITFVLKTKTMSKKLEQVSLFLIDQTSRKAKQYSQSVFDNSGIDLLVDQWVLLKIIDENIPMSQKELATKSFRDPASITRTIDILEKKGYVRREKLASDRRQYIVMMSEKGKKLISSKIEIINEMRARSLKGFSEHDALQLNSMLLKIQNNFI